MARITKDYLAAEVARLQKRVEELEAEVAKRDSPAEGRADDLEEKLDDLRKVCGGLDDTVAAFQAMAPEGCPLDLWDPWDDWVPDRVRPTLAKGLRAVCDVVEFLAEGDE